MKKLIAICLVCVVVFSASGALAGTVTVGRGLYESRGGYQDGELYITPHGVPGLLDDVRIGTFCVEMTEAIGFTTYNAVISDAAIKGSTSTSDPLSPKTAWLFYQYLTGAIVIDTGAKATDFQYAIWKLEDEDTQAPGDWATIVWTPAAQAYYNLAMASTWQTTGPIHVLNLGAAPTYPVQDLLIPEPATIAILGLGALSLIRRKK